MFLVLLSYLAFFSIALPDSMLGVAWPAMRISFHQPISAAGVVPPLLSGGAIDATLNTYAARTFGPRRINFLHASYGVGAAASPLIVTAVLGTDATWRWAYATAERTSPAVADRMIGFQASASALGAAVIPLLISLAMGVSAAL